MKFTGITFAGLVSCVAALPPMGFFPPPPPLPGTPSATPSATPSSSALPSSSIVTPTPTGFPLPPFEKRQFELPSGFSSLPIPFPTDLPFEKRQGFPGFPPPPFPTPSSSSVVASSTATPSATPF